MKTYIGANGDWLLMKNMCGVPMAVKGIENVRMMIFEGLNGENAELSIHFNPYLPDHQKRLSFKDFESACNEADDYYRSILTEAIEYLTKQIKLLPEI